MTITNVEFQIKLGMIAQKLKSISNNISGFNNIDQELLKGSLKKISDALNALNEANELLQQK